MSQGGPYVAVPELQPDGQSYIYRAKRHAPIPSDLRFVVADCIHNLRAALDNLTFQLVRCYGPPGLVEFPVCRDRQDFDAFALRHFQKLPQEAIGKFEALQPYHGPYPRWHPIRHLNRLWIADKHRASLVAGAAPGMPISYWEVLSGNPDCVVYTGQPVDEGVIVAAAWVKAGKQAEFEGHVSISVGIDERGPVMYRMLPSQLITFHQVVRNMAINELRPFFR